MASEFNADEFCSDMQSKAKELAKIKNSVNKRRTKTGLVTVIINGERITHRLPCDIEKCKTCEIIRDVELNVDHMMLEMRNNLFDIFGDFFK